MRYKLDGVRVIVEAAKLLNASISWIKNKFGG